MAKTKRRMAVKVAEKERETKTCETCHGKKFEELEHGLILRRCRACKGTGRIEIES